MSTLSMRSAVDRAVGALETLGADRALTRFLYFFEASPVHVAHHNVYVVPRHLLDAEATHGVVAQFQRPSAAAGTARARRLFF